MSTGWMAKGEEKGSYEITLSDSLRLEDMRIAFSNGNPGVEPVQLFCPAQQSRKVFFNSCEDSWSFYRVECVLKDKRYKDLSLSALRRSQESGNDVLCAFIGANNKLYRRKETRQPTFYVDHHGRVDDLVEDRSYGYWLGAITALRNGWPGIEEVVSATSVE